MGLVGGTSESGQRLALASLSAAVGRCVGLRGAIACTMGDDVIIPIILCNGHIPLLVIAGWLSSVWCWLYAARPVVVSTLVYQGITERIPFDILSAYALFGLWVVGT